MFRTQTTATSQASRSSEQDAGRPAGVIPNFHHLSSNSPVALESYIHLYLEGAARSGLDGSGTRRKA